jgi:hypothetical protein
MDDKVIADLGPGNAGQMTVSADACKLNLPAC